RGAAREGRAHGGPSGSRAEERPLSRLAQRRVAKARAGSRAPRHPVEQLRGGSSPPLSAFPGLPPTAVGLLPQFPDGAAGRVAQLDARRDQAVAHTVGELEGARRAQLAAKRDEVLDQRSQELPRGAEAAPGGLAQAQD